jgi:hypothetical protein
LLFCLTRLLTTSIVKKGYLSIVAHMEMVRKTHGDHGAGHMEIMWTKKHRAEGDETEK